MEDFTIRKLDAIRVVAEVVVHPSSLLDLPGLGVKGWCGEVTHWFSSRATGRCSIMGRLSDFQDFVITDSEAATPAVVRDKRTAASSRVAVHRADGPHLPPNGAVVCPCGSFELDGISRLNGAYLFCCWHGSGFPLNDGDVGDVLVSRKSLRGV